MLRLIHPESPRNSQQHIASNGRTMTYYRDADYQSELFELALDIDRGNELIHWSYARVALSTGNASTAVENLNPILHRIREDPFVYMDALLAFSKAGMSEQVIEIYEASESPIATELISDTVALAYMDGQSWAAAKWLRPYDLYANYQLFESAQRSGEVSQALRLHEELTHFPFETLVPSNESLLTYVAEAIPALLKDGIWDRDLAIGAISFLVLRYHHLDDVEQLLERLSSTYPSDPAWMLYLGELNLRQGELSNAKRFYQEAAALDPADRNVHLRLGMVNEMLWQKTGARSAGLEALSSYQNHYMVAPDDLMGLVKIAEICSLMDDDSLARSHCQTAAEFIDPNYHATGSLTRSPAAILQDQWNTYADSSELVIGLLGLSHSDFELGPNLVLNSGFEEWLDIQSERTRRPKWWLWSDMFSRKPFNEALFIGGEDDFSAPEGQMAARIDGLWVAQQEGKELARAGFWNFDESLRGLRQIPLEADSAYLLTFLYRTERVSDNAATFWHGGTGEATQLLPIDAHGLPATEGAWYRFVAIGWNRDDNEWVLSPLLRLYQPGTVQFDDVEIEMIRFKSGVPIIDRQPRFRVMRGA
ncbi:MAG TPA: hypothetical protein VFI27_18885 [candidate division Zixibacteria bacterium]|nr:hypothetical protein [candidate division Zixibacteria bacterium]